ncbi:uncharacterized protein si:ch211-238e22.2 [Cyprinus carpio]|uniref:Uncharacterized protein si:ch211-238e22.2 n=1 Tax=Cyprinus carpio TaxID=7962 RepID=A0A9Q9ZYQ0_CYPCA|nr:uncharacterized protein si:ch211-238e22.2 [Cyprinus carpio]
MVGITALRDVQPNKACWKELPSTVQLNQLNHALMETGPANEFLASVGTTVLTRMDFLTLGHQREVEATDIADLQGIMVHVFNSYVTVTWLPPLCADPMCNVPVSIIVL